MFRLICMLVILAGGSLTAQEKTWRVALISGSLEYASDASLVKLETEWKKRYNAEFVRIFRKTDTDLPGLEKLAECDVAVFFTRRLKPSEAQLEGVKKYLASGKPVIGIRTSSHGFQNYLEMDQLVFGGDYKGHTKPGPACQVALEEKAIKHPIVAGIEPFSTPGTLYKNAKIAEDTTVLLTGRVPTEQYPVAWVRERMIEKKAQRVFYTSLGHQADFENEKFLKLMTNALHWVEPSLPKKP
ncbi:MAG: ThuA domain-containing protein [Fimbriiglobus sp.]